MRVHVVCGYMYTESYYKLESQCDRFVIKVCVRSSDERCMHVLPCVIVYFSVISVTVGLWTLHLHVLFTPTSSPFMWPPFTMQCISTVLEVYQVITDRPK